MSDTCPVCRELDLAEHSLTQEPARQRAGVRLVVVDPSDKAATIALAEERAQARTLAHDQAERRAAEVLADLASPEDPDLGE